MARFKEGVRLYVEFDNQSDLRPVAIAILPSSENRAQAAGTTLGLKVHEAADLIVELTNILAVVDRDTAIAALTRAADNINR